MVEGREGEAQGAETGLMARSWVHLPLLYSDQSSELSSISFSNTFISRISSKRITNPEIKKQHFPVAIQVHSLHCGHVHGSGVQ